MREYIGVKSFTSLRTSSLKRDALLFDRIALLRMGLMSQRGRASIDAELAWLSEEGFILEPEIEDNDDLEKMSEDYREYLKLGLRQLGTLQKALPESEFPIIKKYFSRFLLEEEAMVRLISLYLRKHENMNAVPILMNDPQALQETEAKKCDVLQITINAMPVPDDSVSWEQILDYRADPDTRSRRLALRNWMNEITHAKLNPIEIEERLEFLIDRYQQYMKLHRMKTNAKVLETVVVASAEFLEDLIKRNWGKAAKALFAFKHRKIALMEGELTAPGNEIAYIVKAREKFS